jgi:hypothetical protein
LLNIAGRAKYCPGNMTADAPNALRAAAQIKPSNRTRPDGEEGCTAEWELYNILEMKFLEGKKKSER